MSSFQWILIVVSFCFSSMVKTLNNERNWLRHIYFIAVARVYTEVRSGDQEPELEIELEEESLLHDELASQSPVDTNTIKMVEKKVPQTQPTFWGLSVANTRRTVLLLCVLHNSVHTVLLRYTRARNVPEMYLSSVAVMFTEFMKLFVCTLLVVREEAGFDRAANAIYSSVILHPMDTLKVGVLAFLYTMQTNLFYLGATHLEAAPFMVTSQLKIFTTAVFSVSMLNKHLSGLQWLALIALFSGVSMVQMPAEGTPPPEFQHDQNPLVGFLAVVAASTISGFAGIYFEKILKGATPVSLWMRNVQLATCAIPISFITCLVKDYAHISAKGWLYGFDGIVWCMVFWYGLGGLAVAVTIKYADNILKNFATALAIVNSTLASIYIFSFIPSHYFLIGASVTIGSIFLYSSEKAQPK